MPASKPDRRRVFLWMNFVSLLISMTKLKILKVGSLLNYFLEIAYELFFWYSTVFIDIEFLEYELDLFILSSF